MESSGDDQPDDDQHDPPFHPALLVDPSPPPPTMHVPSATGSRSSQDSSSVRPRRGRGTRSVGVESSTVGSWLLQAPAPGGPKIIDLIPSFIGHITYRMCREGVTCRPASTFNVHLEEGSESPTGI